MQQTRQRFQLAVCTVLVMLLHVCQGRTLKAGSEQQETIVLKSIEDLLALVPDASVARRTAAAGKRGGNASAHPRQADAMHMSHTSTGGAAQAPAGGPTSYTAAADDKDSYEEQGSYGAAPAGAAEAERLAAALGASQQPLVWGSAWDGDEGVAGGDSSLGVYGRELLQSRRVSRDMSFRLRRLPPGFLANTTAVAQLQAAILGRLLVRLNLPTSLVSLLRPPMPPAPPPLDPVTGPRAWGADKVTTGTRLARYMSLVKCDYDSPTGVKQYACSLCFTDGTSFIGSYEDATYVKDMVIVNADAVLGGIVVTFRSTNNIDQWINNAVQGVVSKAPFTLTDGTEGGSVHAGFLRGYRGLRAELVKLIKQATKAHPDLRTLYVVGHSRGAALASIAALDLAHGGAAEAGFLGFLQLWAYGQPRAGDQAFCDAIEASGSITVRWRVMWRADPVVDAPLAAMGYEHWNPAVWYTQDPSTLASTLLNKPYSYLKVADASIYVCQDKASYNSGSCRYWSLLPLQLLSPLGYYNDHGLYFDISMSGEDKCRNITDADPCASSRGTLSCITDGFQALSTAVGGISLPRISITVPDAVRGVVDVSFLEGFDPNFMVRAAQGYIVQAGQQLQCRLPIYSADDIFSRNLREPLQTLNGDLCTRLPIPRGSEPGGGSFYLIGAYRASAPPNDTGLGDTPIGGLRRQQLQAKLASMGFAACAAVNPCPPDFDFYMAFEGLRARWGLNPSNPSLSTGPVGAEVSLTGLGFSLNGRVRLPSDAKTAAFWTEDSGFKGAADASIGISGTPRPTGHVYLGGGLAIALSSSLAMPVSMNISGGYIIVDLRGSMGSASTSTGDGFVLEMGGSVVSPPSITVPGGMSLGLDTAAQPTSAAPIIAGIRLDFTSSSDWDLYGSVTGLSFPDALTSLLGALSKGNAGNRLRTALNIDTSQPLRLDAYFHASPNTIALLLRTARLAFRPGTIGSTNIASVLVTLGVLQNETTVIEGPAAFSVKVSGLVSGTVSVQIGLSWGGLSMIFKSCTASGGCPGDTRCLLGILCVEPLPQGFPCTADTDCDSGLCGFSGKQNPALPICGSCFDNAQCGNGTVCNGIDARTIRQIAGLSGLFSGSTTKPGFSLADYRSLYTCTADRTVNACPLAGDLSCINDAFAALTLPTKSFPTFNAPGSPPISMFSFFDPQFLVDVANSYLDDIKAQLSCALPIKTGAEITDPNFSLNVQSNGACAALPVDATTSYIVGAFNGTVPALPNLGNLPNFSALQSARTNLQRVLGSVRLCAAVNPCTNDYLVSLSLTRQLDIQLGATRALTLGANPKLFAYSERGLLPLQGTVPLWDAEARVAGPLDPTVLPITRSDGNVLITASGLTLGINTGRVSFGVNVTAAQVWASGLTRGATVVYAELTGVKPSLTLPGSAVAVDLNKFSTPSTAAPVMNVALLAEIGSETDFDVKASLGITAPVATFLSIFPDAIKNNLTRLLVPLNTNPITAQLDVHVNPRLVAVGLRLRGLAIGLGSIGGINITSKLGISPRFEGDLALTLRVPLGGGNPIIGLGLGANVYFEITPCSRNSDCPTPGQVCLLGFICSDGLPDGLPCLEDSDCNSKLCGTSGKSVPALPVCGRCFSKDACTNGTVCNGVDPLTLRNIPRLAKKIADKNISFVDLTSFYTCTAAPIVNKCPAPGDLSCIEKGLALLSIPTDGLPTLEAPGGVSLFKAFDPAFLADVANALLDNLKAELLCSLPIYDGAVIGSSNFTLNAASRGACINAPVRPGTSYVVGAFSAAALQALPLGSLPVANATADRIRNTIVSALGNLGLCIAFNPCSLDFALGLANANLSLSLGARAVPSSVVFSAAVQPTSVGFSMEGKLPVETVRWWDTTDPSPATSLFKGDSLSANFILRATTQLSISIRNASSPGQNRLSASFNGAAEMAVFGAFGGSSRRRLQQSSGGTGFYAYVTGTPTLSLGGSTTLDMTGLSSAQLSTGVFYQGQTFKFMLSVSTPLANMYSILPAALRTQVSQLLVPRSTSPSTLELYVHSEPDLTGLFIRIRNASVAVGSIGTTNVSALFSQFKLPTSFNGSVGLSLKFGARGVSFGVAVNTFYFEFVSCETDADCGQGRVCVLKAMCTSRLPRFAPCIAPNQCASGKCGIGSPADGPALPVCGDCFSKNDCNSGDVCNGMDFRSMRQIAQFAIKLSNGTLDLAPFADFYKCGPQSVNKCPTPAGLQCITDAFDSIRLPVDTFPTFEAPGGVNFLKAFDPQFMADMVNQALDDLSAQLSCSLPIYTGRQILSATPQIAAANNFTKLFNESEGACVEMADLVRPANSYLAIIFNSKRPIPDVPPFNTNNSLTQRLGFINNIMGRLKPFAVCGAINPCNNDYFFTFKGLTFGVGLPGASNATSANGTGVVFSIALTPRAFGYSDSTQLSIQTGQLWDPDTGGNPVTANFTTRTVAANVYAKGDLDLGVVLRGANCPDRACVTVNFTGSAQFAYRFRPLRGEQEGRNALYFALVGRPSISIANVVTLNTSQLVDPAAQPAAKPTDLAISLLVAFGGGDAVDLTLGLRVSTPLSTFFNALGTGPGSLGARLQQLVRPANNNPVTLDVQVLANKDTTGVMLRLTGIDITLGSLDGVNVTRYLSILKLPTRFTGGIGFMFRQRAGSAPAIGIGINDLYLEFGNCLRNTDCGPGLVCLTLPNPPFDSIPGICVAPLPHGIPCTSDEQCTSGMCGFKDKAFPALPVCGQCFDRKDCANITDPVSGKPFVCTGADVSSVRLLPGLVQRLRNGTLDAQYLSQFYKCAANPAFGACNNKGSLPCINELFESIPDIPVDKFPTFEAPGGVSFFNAFNPQFLAEQANNLVDDLAAQLQCSLPIYKGSTITAAMPALDAQGKNRTAYAFDQQKATNGVCTQLNGAISPTNSYIVGVISNQMDIPFVTTNTTVNVTTNSTLTATRQRLTNALRAIPPYYLCAALDPCTNKYALALKNITFNLSLPLPAAVRLTALITPLVLSYDSSDSIPLVTAARFWDTSSASTVKARFVQLNLTGSALVRADIDLSLAIRAPPPSTATRARLGFKGSVEFLLGGLAGSDKEVYFGLSGLPTLDVGNLTLSTAGLATGANQSTSSIGIGFYLATGPVLTVKFAVQIRTPLESLFSVFPGNISTLLRGLLVPVWPGPGPQPNPLIEFAVNVDDKFGGALVRLTLPVGLGLRVGQLGTTNVTSLLQRLKMPTQFKGTIALTVKVLFPSNSLRFGVGIDTPQISNLYFEIGACSSDADCRLDGNTNRICLFNFLCVDPLPRFVPCTDDAQCASGKCGATGKSIPALPVCGDCFSQDDCADQTGPTGKPFTCNGATPRTIAAIPKLLRDFVSGNISFGEIPLYTCSLEPGRVCFSEPGTHHHGGGFQSGSSIDTIAPYPLTTQTADLCSDACRSAPNCRVWSWLETTKGCFRLSSAFNGTTGDATYTSGTCSLPLGSCPDKGTLPCLSDAVDSIPDIPTDNFPTFEAPGGISLFNIFSPTFLAQAANDLIDDALAVLQCALPVYRATTIYSPAFKLRPASRGVCDLLPLQTNPDTSYVVGVYATRSINATAVGGGANVTTAANRSALARAFPDLVVCAAINPCFPNLDIAVSFTGLNVTIKAPLPSSIEANITLAPQVVAFSNLGNLNYTTAVGFWDPSNVTNGTLNGIGQPLLLTGMNAKLNGTVGLNLRVKDSLGNTKSALNFTGNTTLMFDFPSADGASGDTRVRFYFELIGGVPVVAMGKGGDTIDLSKAGGQPVTPPPAGRRRVLGYGPHLGHTVVHWNEFDPWVEVGDDGTELSDLSEEESEQMEEEEKEVHKDLLAAYDYDVESTTSSSVRVTPYGSSAASSGNSLGVISSEDAGLAAIGARGIRAMRRRRLQQVPTTFRTGVYLDHVSSDNFNLSVAVSITAQLNTFYNVFPTSIASRLRALLVPVGSAPSIFDFNVFASEDDASVFIRLRNVNVRIGTYNTTNVTAIFDRFKLPTTYSGDLGLMVKFGDTFAVGIAIFGFYIEFRPCSTRADCGGRRTCLLGGVCIDPFPPGAPCLEDDDCLSNQCGATGKPNPALPLCGTCFDNSQCTKPGEVCFGVDPLSLVKLPSYIKGIRDGSFGFQNLSTLYTCRPRSELSKCDNRGSLPCIDALFDTISDKLLPEPEQGDSTKGGMPDAKAPAGGGNQVSFFKLFDINYLVSVANEYLQAAEALLTCLIPVYTGAQIKSPTWELRNRSRGACDFLPLVNNRSYVVGVLSFGGSGANDTTIPQGRQPYLGNNQAAPNPQTQAQRQSYGSSTRNFSICAAVNPCLPELDIFIGLSGVSFNLTVPLIRPPLIMTVTPRAFAFSKTAQASATTGLGLWNKNAGSLFNATGPTFSLLGNIYLEAGIQLTQELAATNNAGASSTISFTGTVKILINYGPIRNPLDGTSPPGSHMFYAELIGTLPRLNLYGSHMIDPGAGGAAPSPTIGSALFWRFYSSSRYDLQYTLQLNATLPQIYGMFPASINAKLNQLLVPTNPNRQVRVELNIHVDERGGAFRITAKGIAFKFGSLGGKNTSSFMSSFGLPTSFDGDLGFAIKITKAGQDYVVLQVDGNAFAFQECQTNADCIEPGTKCLREFNFCFSDNLAPNGWPCQTGDICWNRKCGRQQTVKKVPYNALPVCGKCFNDVDCAGNPAGDKCSTGLIESFRSLLSDVSAGTLSIASFPLYKCVGKTGDCPNRGTLTCINLNFTMPSPGDKFPSMSSGKSGGTSFFDGFSPAYLAEAGQAFLATLGAELQCLIPIYTGTAIKSGNPTQFPMGLIGGQACNELPVANDQSYIVGAFSLSPQGNKDTPAGSGSSSSRSAIARLFPNFGICVAINPCLPEFDLFFGFQGLRFFITIPLPPGPPLEITFELKSFGFSKRGKAAYTQVAGMWNRSSGTNFLNQPAPPATLFGNIFFKATMEIRYGIQSGGITVITIGFDATAVLLINYDLDLWLEQPPSRRPPVLAFQFYIEISGSPVVELASGKFPIDLKKLGQALEITAAIFFRYRPIVRNSVVTKETFAFQGGISIRITVAKIAKAFPSIVETAITMLIKGTSYIGVELAISADEVGIGIRLLFSANLELGDLLSTALKTFFPNIPTKFTGAIGAALDVTWQGRAVFYLIINSDVYRIPFCNGDNDCATNEKCFVGFCVPIVGCTRTFTRFDGVAVDSCPAGTERGPSWGSALCYPPCRSGYYSPQADDSFCRAYCPAGYTGTILTCWRGTDDYGKGCCCIRAGCFIWCWGESCCGCSRSGYTDTGCTCHRPLDSRSRDWYGRGGGRALTCRPGLEQIDPPLGLCYNACPSGWYKDPALRYNCATNCPPEFPYNCGTFCGKNGCGLDAAVTSTFGRCRSPNSG